MMRLGPFTFGYNAVEDKDRRQRPQTRVYHEAEVLTERKRRKLQATAQDQTRNHSLPAWMVRKHLDYVSKFHFSFRTAQNQADAARIALDNLVNRIFRWHGAPRNLDFLGRFGRDELFRFFELEKVLCGDAALIKVADLKLQALESDLIAKGEGLPEGSKVNDSGLLVDEWGRAIQFCVCQRGVNGAKPKFHHMEPAENVIFDAYWSRFSSQFRGVSPLSTAINTVQDIHEGLEFNIVKAKMHALFGIAIMRDAEGDANMGGAAGATAETESATASADGSTFDINPRAVNVLDLKPGEDAKVIESGTPSSEFIEGMYLYVQIAMLALDIPVTCFDSRRSSFSARIADLNEYEVSADYKRTKNRYVRQAYSDWVLASIWNDAASPWPLRSVAESAGMQLRDVQESVEWIPSGSPWLDKYAQIQGDQLGIALGLDNPIDAARRRGMDVFDNIDKLSQVQNYAKERGVAIQVGTLNDRTIGDVVRDEVNRQKSQENEDE